MDLRPWEPAPLYQVIAAGMDSWRAFAPSGWQPPHQDETRDSRMRERLARPQTWCRVAWDGDEPAGVVAISVHNEDPGTGYLWVLFVRPEWWGSGLATRLHDAALEKMRERGYASAELWTPRDHRRARRFYEREGWRATSAGRPTDIGLPEVQYRRALTS